MKVAVSSVLLIALFLLALLPVGYAQDWPMFREDLKHNGVSGSEGPNDNTLYWSYLIHGDVHSSPAVVNGRVYIGSRNDYKIYSLDENNGGVLWSYQTGGYIYSSPAVVNGKLYIGSWDTNVYCFDAEGGAELWEHKTGYQVYSSPAVANGKVYIGSHDGYFYALNADTGNLAWDAPFPTRTYLYSSPAVAQGFVYFGSAQAIRQGDESYEGIVYALNADTGALVWKFNTKGPIYSSPVIADGKVYIGSDDKNLYCLNASTGAKLWSYPTGDAISSSPAVVNGLVYFGSLDHWVYALDAQNGTKIWSFETGSGVHSSPAIADGKVYIGSYDKKVYCLNAGTGDLIWSYQTGDIVHSSPAVADNKVFVGSYDGNLYCFASDFVVSVTPTSGTVSPGGTIDATVNVKIVGSVNVELSAVGAPNDMVVNFDPSSSDITFNSTMTIKTTANTPPGAYDIKIVGTGGGKTRTTTYRIQVGNIFLQEALLFIPLILLLLIIPTLRYWWKIRKKYQRSKLAPTGRQTRGILRT